MNSLEKMIDDLIDAKKIVNDHADRLRELDVHDDGNWTTINQLRFVANNIQAAINRLGVLNEEMEGEE